MYNLPEELKLNILDYLYGDNEYWKIKFNKVISELNLKKKKIDEYINFFIEIFNSFNILEKTFKIEKIIEIYPKLLMEKVVSLEEK
tara:strand:- start:73 stop:330 length:258 start_codon:yes stop_codon:yes gene_type:complete